MADNLTLEDPSKALNESPECKDPQSSLLQVSFDVNQMLNTFFALRECAPSPSNTGFTAYLESCLLHFRSVLEFFDGTLSLWKITVRDFAPGDRSLDVIQAPDLAPVRDLIDQYLSCMDRRRTTDFSLRIEEILDSAVVELTKTFESFLDELPAGSIEKVLLENSTRGALRKRKTLEDFKE